MLQIILGQHVIRNVVTLLFIPVVRGEDCTDTVVDFFSSSSSSLIPFHCRLHHPSPFPIPRSHSKNKKIPGIVLVSVTELDVIVVVPDDAPGFVVTGPSDDMVETTCLVGDVVVVVRHALGDL